MPLIRPLTTPLHEQPGIRNIKGYPYWLYTRIKVEACPQRNPNRSHSKAVVIYFSAIHALANEWLAHFWRDKGSPVYNSPVPGYPDLTLAKNNLFIYVYAQGSPKPDVTVPQYEWYRKIQNANIPVYVWRKADLDNIQNFLEHNNPTRELADSLFYTPTPPETLIKKEIA